MRTKLFLRHFPLCLFVLLYGFAASAFAQANNGVIRGTITDPTGAVIPNADVQVTTPGGHVAAEVSSDGAGGYRAGRLAAGTYIVKASAHGFAASAPKAVTVTAGQSRQFDLSLQIEVEKQQVQVDSESTTVDTSPDDNANAIVIKGKDLDALSDDPDELQSELQALAGPAAGPNGGEIYIDGFTGGQIPPKSSIREIRVNQNPFSAEFDRLGYGRIEIFTKPGTDKLHGQIQSRGNVSNFNSQNPILNANLKLGEQAIEEPSYYSYNLNGSLSGPINKNASFFVSVFARNNQNETVIDAADPDDPSSETLNEAVSNPSSRIDVAPRLDFQLGKSNTLTIRDEFYRAVQTNNGLSALTLPEQAYNTHGLENTLQVSDSLVLSKNLVDDIRFQYRRIRNQQLPISNLPTVTLTGQFISGGSNSGAVEDHQDDYELQNYFAAAEGRHSLNFGGRARAYRDANYSTSGANSAYIFNAAGYGSGEPQQYTVTKINNPNARAILFDAALFYQDDWTVSKRFTFSYGMRWETQNRISDKDDWAPRLSLAYALGKQGVNHRPKTVLRAGYGWFYQRFTVPNSFSSTQGTPYLIQAIHNNFVPLGSSEVANEEGYTVTKPPFYNPNAPVTTFPANSSVAAPTGYSLDPHFHAADDMQAAVGLDRQLTKTMTGNVTYLYSRGTHMYLTNNVSAIGSFPEENAQAGTYPTLPIAEPTENDMQYQSGGVYRQNQLIASVTARYSRFSLFSFYTYNNARSDTSGVTYTPSIARDPGFDYGRASFDVHNRFLILGNFTAPWQLSFAPFLSVNSGTPYNITVTSDLTGNNQFNARPTYAASCSQAGAVATAYGCLDGDPLTSPTGASERIVPYDLGTGPKNVSMNLRISKVIGFGPRVGGNGGGEGGGQRGSRGGGLGGRGLSGSQGGPGRLDATTAHKYNLTFIAFGQNVFNHENLGAPNGVLGSSFFGRSQSLASGFFGPSTAGNRSIFLEANFNF